MQVLGTRLLTQRAMLSPPHVGAGLSTLSGSRRLCHVLARPGCLRAHILDRLGQSQCASHCGTCDACVLDGAKPLAGGSSLGGLPYRCAWYDATDAAAAVLSTRGLSLDPDGIGGVKGQADRARRLAASQRACALQPSRGTRHSALVPHCHRELGLPRGERLARRLPCTRLLQSTVPATHCTKRRLPCT